MSNQDEPDPLSQHGSAEVSGLTPEEYRKLFCVLLPPLDDELVDHQQAQRYQRRYRIEGDEPPRFTMEIPVAEVAKIEAALRRAGEEVTDRVIQRMYRQMQGLK